LGCVLRGYDVAFIQEHRAVFLFRHQKEILSAGDVEQDASRDFIKICERIDGAIEILALFEVTAREKQIAQSAIGEVECPADALLTVKISTKAPQKRAELLHLPYRQMRERSRQGFRQSPITSLDHAVERRQRIL